MTKRYLLGHERSNARAALPGRWGEPRGGETFLALDDVNLQVHAGEAVGIVGQNGAGKSTALKIIAGVVRPTSGEAVTRGRIVSIIELGLGFNPDFTGDENLEYGGALLGMSLDEITAKRDEIMDFAELESFSSMPVKRYSTGMLARLGFALATAVEADAYVVDEVLSVGDWGFQRKSLARMQQLRDDGATMVFVSHNLWVVNQLCDRAILLDEGRVTAAGAPSDVLGVYLGDPSIHLRDPRSGSTLADAMSSGAMAVGDDRGLTFEEQAGLARVEGQPDFVPSPAAQLGAAIAFRSLEVTPKEIEPGEPATLRGQIQVRRAIEGARLLVGLYWRGFAAMAEADEVAVDFLQTPGVWDFEVSWPYIPTCNALLTVQASVVVGPVDEDPEQFLPGAIAKAAVDIRVGGEVTSRPGMWLPRTVTIAPASTAHASAGAVDPPGADQGELS